MYLEVHPKAVVMVHPNPAYTKNKELSINALSWSVDGVMSPWQNPLPKGKYVASRVVVYFHNGEWIPIAYSSLAQAIALHRRGQALGQEIFIFPPNVKPLEFVQMFNETPWSSGSTKTNPGSGKPVKQAVGSGMS